MEEETEGSGCKDGRVGRAWPEGVVWAEGECGSEGGEKTGRETRRTKKRGAVSSSSVAILLLARFLEICCRNVGRRAGREGITYDSPHPLELQPERYTA